MSDDKDAIRSRGKALEYKLELDLHLFFTPLMQDWGDGIVMTRTLQLPFPPDNKVAIGGRSMEGDGQPLGYRLRDTVWDVDRARFIATTISEHGGGPLAYIPDDIDRYFSEGWSIGSWQKHYDKSWKSPIGDRFDRKKFDFELLDEDDLYELETMPASKRPEPFHTLMSALVRLLFILYNNEALAYAMYKTKTYFQDDEKQLPKFKDAMHRYEQMTSEEQVNALLNAKSQRAAIASCNDSLKIQGKSGRALRAAKRLKRALADQETNFAEVVAAVVSRHRPIEDSFCDDVGMRLMRIDSDIAMEVFDHFAQLGVPCLGVHDSFIVPAKHERTLREVMTNFYAAKLGFEPELS
ncbi:hypothetical protein [Roseimaritima ulvae]|uniref:Uncharacterized protein n=1 Tax=Roseimaritima ulvae TaxID=980254 RepID=A0A5B9R381_9BACT|nr:hypothetical protein [Roseimaritima ulvae]QEG40783.1 hypothetical protein UC8_28010 [Roseimaritima ulvae]